MRIYRDLRLLLAGVGYRRLFVTRIVAQLGDGFFQAGLASVFFFSPERLATATDVALAFVVMLVPFTLIGPWVGVFLDRWRRRQVLVVANLIRALVTIAIVALMLTPTGGMGGVYVLALICLGLNRFLLSALSAGLPHVVPARTLLLANSITPTLGTLGYGLGILIAGGIRVAMTFMAGDLPVVDASILGAAAVAFVLAAVAATRLGRDELGPHRRDAVTIPLRQAFRTTASQLAQGARYLIRNRTPAIALTLMGIHRFIYGMTLISGILIARNLLADPTDLPAGLAAFAALAAATAAGVAAAVVVTPLAHEVLSPGRWITVCLVTAALAQATVAVTATAPVLIAASFILGIAAQGTKIAVDTIVQRDTTDEYRGRAFSFYDMIYNAAFATAAALGAVLLPTDGYSSLLYAALAAAYLSIAAWASRTLGRSPRITASRLGGQAGHR